VVVGIGWRASVILGLVGCGPTIAHDQADSTEATAAATTGATTAPMSTSASAATTDEASTGETTATTAADSGDTTTGEQPLLPECDEQRSCGDGIVDSGEACDDANADDEDGCSQACERPAPVAFPPIDLYSLGLAAAVDADGSVLVAGTSPAVIVRLGPDGQPLASSPLEVAPGVSIRVDGLHIGAQIVVVGNDLDAIAGIVWRFAPDLTPLGVAPDGEGRWYGGSGFASDGGLVVLTNAPGSGETFVERRAPDGSLLWSRSLDPDAVIAGSALAIAADDVVFVAGGIPGLGEAAIVRMTNDASTELVLSPPDYPNTYLERIAATPDGGAVAVGDSGGYPFIVSVDADGALRWVSTCSGRGVRARAIRVVDDRVLLAGDQYGAETCGPFRCTKLPWIQHLDLEGTVLANDAPEELLAEGDHAGESIVAVGRHPDGSVVALGADTGMQSIVFVSRFAW
jgi:cysteine-rich repeat protein